MGASVSVIGNVNVDLLLSPVPALPPPGTERTVERADLRAAGSAGNAALALARLGAAPRLAGAVGDDAMGRFLTEELERAGVHGVFASPGKATGVSVGFEAPGRDRSFLTHLGGLASFGLEDVREDALGADFVLVCGYFLLPSMRGEPTARLLREVRSRGGTTFFDCGWDPDGWAAETREEVLRLLAHVDVFLPNEAEALVLAGSVGAEDAAEKLRRASGGWVVVKLGAEGCLVVGPDGKGARTAAPAVNVVDTTGAGDALNAGLMHALSMRRPMAEAADFAVRLASAVVSRPSLDRHPTAEELDADAL